MLGIGSELYFSLQLFCFLPGVSERDITGATNGCVGCKSQIFAGIKVSRRGSG